MKTKMYYLGRECELIHKINDSESLIEIVSNALIWRGSGDYECPEPDYIEPEFTSIIVSNKYLSEIKNSILEHIDKLELEAEERARKIIEDANSRKYKIENEIRDLHNSKQELAKKYKDVALVETALGLVMRDREYYLHLDNYRPRLLKDKDFKDDDYIKAVIMQRNRHSTSRKVKVVVGQYSDGSGHSSDEAIPCDSIEEVREHFGVYVEKLLREGRTFTGAFIDFADEIEFKHEAIEVRRAELLTISTTKKLKEINQAKKNLARLNSQL